MKTKEQNQKEVMNYLEKSSKHFFESEDGQHWQAIVKLHAIDKFVFIKNGEVIELNLDWYLSDTQTAGKTFLRRRVHPNWTISDRSSWYNGYGHGSQKNLRAVKWNKTRLELTANAAQEYLQKGS